MSYDPCGTQRLEGDDILKRLAKHLNVDVRDLTQALLRETTRSQKYREFNEVRKEKDAQVEDGGCGCGD